MSETKTSKRVVVLMGGLSAEREVSLMSGQGVAQALRDKGYDVHTWDPKTDTLADLQQGGYEAAFIALHGGLGENGSIQGLLNVLNLPYTGPGVKASGIAIDKEMTKVIWASAGIPVPQGVQVTGALTDEALQRLIDTLGATGLVVKPNADGSSIGVTKLDAAALTVASLRQAIEKSTALGEGVLVEEYIHGREFTVAVIQGQALPIIEIVAPEGSYDFENKYYTDVVQYVCPAHLAAEQAESLKSICEKAFATIGCRGWSRIDVLQRADGSFVLLEINTSPGMTGHSLVPMAAKATGVDYASLCAQLIESARVD